VPGRGLVVGLCGLAALLLSLFALPWVTEGGDDITFKDIRDSFHPDDRSATVPGGGLDSGGVPPTTYLVPESDPLPQTVPVPETVYVPPSSDQRLETLQEYTDWTWALVVYFAAAAVVFSTWIVPTGRGLRTLTGFLTVPCLGMIVNLVDKDGSNAPRVVSVLAALYASLVHGQALWYLFWDVENSPSPAVGVWLGVAGLIAVIVACVMGTRREVVPQYS
jgi:hypothetical protein